MTFITLHKRPFAVSTRLILFVFMLFYLVFHMLHGERGVFALVQSQSQLEETEEQLLAARQARIALEHRVKGLRNGKLDLDLLDEQARSMLGLFRPDEFVLVWPQS